MVIDKQVKYSSCINYAVRTHNLGGNAVNYPLYFLILYVSVCLLSMAIGIFVLLNNRKEPAGKVFFAMALSVNVWSIGLGIATISSDIATSEIWRRVASFGWGTIFAIMLHFVLIITGRDTFLKKWWQKLLLYLPAVLCMLAFGLPVGLNKTPFNLQYTPLGWINVAEHNLWDLLFYAYYISYTVTGLVLLLRWSMKSSDPTTKKQLRVIVLSFTIALVLSSITDVIMRDTPQVAPIVILIPILVTYQTFMKRSLGINKPHTQRKRLPGIVIIIVVVLYLMSTFLQASLTRTTDIIIFGFNDGLALRGIITQLQMLLSIYLVLMESKAGFITAILINVINLIASLSAALRIKTASSLPGTISYLFTLLIIVLIWMYKKKTAKNIQKINEQSISLRISEQKLYHMAYHDPLTGLYNKEWFVEHLGKSIHKARRSASLIGIIFLDLDSFKAINDTMGHSIGDSVLKTISSRLSSCLREEDVIARFGGDEFLMMVENISTQEELKKITDRIMNSFNECIYVQDVEYFLTASVGVAVYPVDGEDPDALIKNADISMYEAKATGKNRCVYCTPAMKDEAIKKMRLANNLYRALERNEFYLEYQPQVKVDTQEIIGFEVLLRWNNKEYGRVSPDVFIPMAEQTGLIRPIGLWAIKTACEQFNTFKNGYGKDIFVSVNLSIEQLKDGSITEKIRKILCDTGMKAQSFQIEITESVAFNEDPHILQRLKDIRDLGISVSIDDFGKGYSSLNRLKTFPIDLLKIDMDFVHGITSKSQKDRAIIKSIIQIAKNLKIKVLAEGVETEEQVKYLRKHGCDMIQGYYFYKPMPASEVQKLICNNP